MAAIKLQSHWRARQARRKMKDRLRSQAERKIRARAERRAVMGLQKAWRARVARRRVDLKRAQNRAALRIQRIWRGKKGRFSAMLLSRAKWEMEEQVGEEEDEEMPPGWEKFNDSESGEVYYYNETTDAVVSDLAQIGNAMWGGDWEEEKEAGVLQIGKWQVLSDEEEAATLGRMYFYDAESGHVTWRCPEELQGQVERNPHDIWQVSVDADSGHKTYFNIDTNEHTWMRPLGLGVDPDRKPGDEWLATVHVVSGEPYYTNLDTGDVVWERPQVLGMLWEEKIESEAPYSTFWQNKITGEVTSERPLEYMSPVERQAAIEKMNAKTWYAQLDETSGKEYYVLWNPQTEAVDKVTWDKPDELMTPEEMRAKERTQWDTYWSAEDNAEYYVNRVTEEVTWRKPDCLR